MMGVLLALGSAACYGLADWRGGLLSRRAHFAVVALVGQVGGLVLARAVALVLVLVLVLPSTAPDAAGLAWGALSGVRTGAAMVFCTAGWAAVQKTMAVPVSAVGGVALLVLVGVAVLGDRPSVLSWFGIVIAVPALWSVSSTWRSPRHRRRRASGRWLPDDSRPSPSSSP
ncbi:hypothetical protein [Streptomyces sp. NPDC050704]|uniref:hypothetical protein n=1 Tax=Streptomyces sp. NPDC050704 TaxID=3157219 RepID=UPI0034196C9A